ncbi:MAG: hypothetical protein JXA21_28450 [Anaerolineae bacterium]|nr:hypothetical protein [Anaerolineae bacterium]
MTNEVLFEETVEAISEQEWEAAIASHLAWGETWHGDLPSDVFFGVWAGLAKQTKPLIVTIQGNMTRPVLSVPPGSPLVVENNRIVLDDGRELELKFALQGSG